MVEPLKRYPQAKAVSGWAKLTMKAALSLPEPTQNRMSLKAIVASTGSDDEPPLGLVAAVADVIEKEQLLLTSIISPSLIG